MKNINIITGSSELLDQVRPLWEALNALHIGIGGVFSAELAGRTFDHRKQELTGGAGKLHVAIASEKEAVGYCISTLRHDGRGEIDSLYVKKAYRSRGLGTRLVKGALQWLDENHAGKKVVAVLEGNAEALRFYQRFGFHPRNVELEYVD